MLNSLLANAGTTVLSIFLAIIILLAMITIHEFGHYLAGRILGFKINEFSIGFGPAVFRHVNKKSGVLFCIRVFPLGGYCAFAGEDVEDDEDKKDKDDFHKAENGEAVAAENGEVKTPDGAAKADGAANAETGGTAENSGVFKTGGTAKADEVVKTDGGCAGELTGKAESCAGELPQGKGKDFIDQPPWKRIIVLIAGAFMNYVLAMVLIIIGFFSFGQPAFKFVSVEESTEFSREYCFRAGDVILSANGRTVYLATDLMSALNGRVKGDTVAFCIMRDGKEEDVEIALRADCNFENSSQVSKIWRALGAGTKEMNGGLYWDITSQNCRFSFGATLGRSFGYSYRMAGSIFKVLGELLTGNLGLSAMGGPVTTIKVTGEMAVQGVESFLQVAAYIGVNLAVFNLLPIPALDGSKVVFCLIEWIFRKPVPRKVEAIIHALGFVFILGFAVLVDILQFARCG